MEDLTQTLLTLHHALLVYDSLSSQSTSITTSIMRITRQVERKMRVISEDMREIFVDRERETLIRIKRLMKNAPSSEIKGAHVRIFTNLLKLPDNIPEGISISQIFEEFIKGITFFFNELPVPPGVLVYHRLYSCGPRTSIPFQDVLQNCTQNPQHPGGQERRDAELKIEKCFIERKIFDVLFRRLDLFFPHLDVDDIEKTSASEHLQDKPHRDWLEETEDAFHKCFPFTQFNVKIGFEGIIPVQIRIEKLHKGKLRKVMYFAKKKKFQSKLIPDKIYEDDVLAYIWNGRRYYMQYNSFRNIGPMFVWENNEPPHMDIIEPNANDKQVSFSPITRTT